VRKKDSTAQIPRIWISHLTVLMVSAASPHTSEYVRREFKSLQEKRRDAGHGGGGGAREPILGG
jgi:hypothetical protein